VKLKYLLITSVIGIVAVLGLESTWELRAQGPPTFTPAQAAQGKTAYAQNCASCHGANLDDGEFAPPLKGAAFRQNWGGKTADTLFTFITTRMPPIGPGSLGREVYAQILASVLENNGVIAGVASLPSDTSALKAMVIPPSPQQGSAQSPAGRGGRAGRGPGPGGGLSPFAQLPNMPQKASPLDKFTPVTDATLQNPPAGDWLTWRRTWDDLGFSPLKQIDKANVSDLRVAWTWSLPNGPNENTPLVHDGVIFVHSYGDIVQAFDATNGDLLWQYSRELPAKARPSVKRNMAVWKPSTWRREKSSGPTASARRFRVVRSTRPAESFSKARSIASCELTTTQRAKSFGRPG
jgi:alcohol dehydrogenase (cytochrome c)